MPPAPRGIRPGPPTASLVRVHRGLDQMRREFDRDGYLVCPFVIDHALVDDAIRELRAAGGGWRVDDGGSARVADAWAYSESVRQIACDPRVLDLLKALLDRSFFPFQTLNFQRGSQQRLHSDFFHFGSSDHRLMVGVWVAFEDIHPDSGPLMVVPTSQRLPYTFPKDIGLGRGRRGRPYAQYADYEDWVEKRVAEEGLLPAPVTLRKGEALIWAANLVHGGTTINDPALTRMSQVTHYFGRGQTYFTPMHSSKSVLGRAYRDPFDVGTGRTLFLRRRKARPATT
jgi:ectoine hydroxylase-related dioxygenase (phytanoyl-CoA dioxygenase family)